ncbi:RecF/RecN/SMC [Polychytrium aggregatum]|uniref:RecF/RecN/SMC n=1 Tax=Polychytrium aggregatum TaxID=110093 RepID=UPI0022FEABBD|nr:RecF/RecN/SMC [Polychytrium aggregatum]KAI9209027.1 RecF/RecN/SMC [Polychytrium aggregatum]
MGRLVRIDLENFKSYRGKQTIGPFSSFTSVIGPNGAGKSNLMDAISFVLGIKSQQLRSQQLRELIYTRGPEEHEDDEGRSGDDEDSDEVENVRPKTASVTAVYRQDDGTEVTFSRSISSSGSQYRINNRVVSVDVYLKTLELENILVKARNFLVFQGDIEAIASQSSKDLTRLIEQISGSLEFKKEYEELKAVQERATENSTQNFNKKRGVTAEMKQFREQKDEAEKYERLQSQRAKLLTTHFLWKLFHLEGKVTQMEQVIGEEQAKTGDFNETQDRLERAFKDAKKKQAKVNAELLKCEKIVKDKTRQIDSKKPQLLKIDERILHIRGKLANTRENLSKTEGNLSKQASGAVPCIITIALLDTAYTAAACSASSEKGKALKISERAQAEYREKRNEADAKTAAEKQQLNSLKRQQKSLTESIKRTQDKLDSAKARHQQLLEEKEKFQERQRDLQDNLVTQTRELEQTRRDYEFSQSERRRLWQLENELNEKMADTMQKLMDARTDQRENERERKFKQSLEGMRQLFPGVHGRVVDLCKPTQRKYDVAASIILGRNIDAVIVDDEKTAIECIKYLKDQRAGQGTFLPLDGIVAKPINEKYRSFAKGARLAIDIIQFDPQYERVFRYVCGSGLVCDTLEVARSICYDKNEDVKAVTLDGTVIHKSGLITGGQSGVTKDARRWEERELDNLRKVKDSLANQLAEVQQSRRKAGYDEQMKHAIFMLENKLKFTTSDLEATERKLEAVQKEIKFCADQMRELRSESAETDAGLESINEQIESAEAAIAKVEATIFADFCRRIGVHSVREYEDKLLSSQEEVSQKRLQFTTQKAKLEGEISFNQQLCQEVQTRLERIQTAISKDESLLAELEEEKESYAKEAEALNESLAQSQAELLQLKESLDGHRDAVNDVKKELQSLIKRAEDSSTAITHAETEIEKFNEERFALLRKAKLEEIPLPLVGRKLEAIPLNELERSHGLGEDQMDVDEPSGPSSSTVQLSNIQIDYRSLKADYRENGSSELDVELEENIKGLAAEIERLAPNMKAVERLDDVEERYRNTAREFEQSRREAKSAKDRFNTIKQERYERFYKAYLHISENIGRIYEELTSSPGFPGGVAQLNLDDSDEPFTDSVRYHAVPPMKGFRDMEQLSGGEKTVAALALLFAIHSYRPAPFFVLDEVDAALDNTNVARISRYIQKQAHKDESGVQFIVISLKNTLYEKADALVGIYKDQAEQTSQVLTLDLESRFGTGQTPLEQ